MAPYQVLEYKIAIRPDDIMGGHVNNARYFAYINETFQQWYTGMDLVERPDMNLVPLMAHLAYDFLREMAYPGTVLCRLSVVRVGRSSLEHAVEIIDADNGELCGRGKCVHVWFSRITGKSEAWPAELLAKCWENDSVGGDSAGGAVGVGASASSSRPLTSPSRA